MFVFNKVTGEIYKKFIKGEYCVSGSLLSNDKKISDLKRIIFHIFLFIDHLREEKFTLQRKNYYK